MKVSIIIRTYNRAYIIREAIESALKQTYSNYEIIIVDDGSADKTRDIVATFKDERIRYICHEKNRGVGAACNTGITAATGELVAFLDSDDLWNEDYLARQVDFLTRHPEAGAVFSDVSVVGTPEPIPSLISLMPQFQKLLNPSSRSEEFIISSRDMYLCLLQELPIKPTALIIRREFFAEVGEFNEKWRSGEDWEFLLRLSVATQFGFLGRSLAVQRRTADATHKIWWEQDKAFLLDLFSRAKSSLRNDPEALAAVRQGILSHCNNLAPFYQEKGMRRKAAKVYWRGFKETKDLKVLIRLAAVALPNRLRRSLRGTLQVKSQQIKASQPAGQTGSNTSTNETRLRAAFVPIWHINPYHLALSTALKSSEVAVWNPNSLKDAYNDLTVHAEKIDVLHLHALPYLRLKLGDSGRYVTFLWRLTRILKRNIPVVWTIHEIDNHDSFHPYLEFLGTRFLSRRVDAIIVHGNEAKRLVAERFQISNPALIYVIPHGHYIESYEKNISREAARASLGLSPENLVLLFFGHLRPYKGIPEMVAAFKKIDAPNARLVIAGLPINKAMEDEIGHAVAGDPRIKFQPGRVHEDKVQVYMHACDLVVLPYRRILTSGAAVLAMSFGKACIAPRAGCVTDMMDDTGTIFFDPQQLGDLDRALQEAVASKDKLPAMGAHNLALARRWDWEGIGRQTAAVYRQCIATRQIKG